MKKFDSLVKEAVVRLQEADPTLDPNLSGGDPNLGGGQSAPAAPTQQAPVPAPEEPKPLTSEGARYLTELALKALAFDPNNLPDTDKDIFTQDVTQENAQDLLERIQQIVGSSSALSSS